MLFHIWPVGSLWLLCPFGILIILSLVLLESPHALTEHLAWCLWPPVPTGLWAEPEAALHTLVHGPSHVSGADHLPRVSSVYRKWAMRDAQCAEERARQDPRAQQEALPALAPPPRVCTRQGTCQPCAAVLACRGPSKLGLPSMWPGNRGPSRGLGLDLGLCEIHQWWGLWKLALL